MVDIHSMKRPRNKLLTCNLNSFMQINCKKFVLCNAYPLGGELHLFRDVSLVFQKLSEIA